MVMDPREGRENQNGPLVGVGPLVCAFCAPVPPLALVVPPPLDELDDEEVFC